MGLSIMTLNTSQVDPGLGRLPILQSSVSLVGFSASTSLGTQDRPSVAEPPAPQGFQEGKPRQVAVALDFLTLFHCPQPCGPFQNKPLVLKLRDGQAGHLPFIPQWCSPPVSL